ncbi:MAG: cupin domain-containing protein [Campylobacteraceae bacterium]|jgi:cupin 2 domain-containing protein|nr:cupin domain-containing protein [Campylobacteraceae bacterium]
MGIFDKRPPDRDEIFEILHEQKDIKITHIISSSKLSDNWYDQSEDEFVVVLEGEAVLEIEQREIRLKKGEHIFIKAHTKHRVLSCSDNTHWLSVHINNSTPI